MSTGSRHAARGLLAALALGIGLTAATVAHADRWNGHPFVFVLMTDDGTNCNLGWAEVGRAMDFRFTIAVNAGRITNRLTPEQMHELQEEGFEIAQHGHSHGFDGVPVDCPSPPRGSLQAYFDCPDMDPVAAALALEQEISPERLETLASLPAGSVRTLAYPRHLHSRALIDSLVSEGFIGARFGGNGSYAAYGSGDFDVPARNSWDGGISLYRVPLADYVGNLVGDHSADPPVFYTHEQFVAATQPLIDQAIADGGIFALYAHHFGDTDDTWGDINYGASGLTPTDLEWIVDLVRANGGAIMTFGEAVEYYRARSTMVDMNGDYVWVADPVVLGVADMAADASLAAAPNPCNGGTTIRYRTARPGRVTVDLHDARGRRLARLHDRWQPEGEWSVHWDGRDGRGRAAPSGVYLVRVVSATGAASARITLLK
jgi:hypothetical protein